jgi:hypothetical protein
MATKTEAPTKTVCTCGHEKALHDLQAFNKQCLQLRCNCWDFEEIVQQEGDLK